MFLLFQTCKTLVKTNANEEKCEFRQGHIKLIERNEIEIGCVRDIHECGARAKLEGANGALTGDGDYCIGGGPLRPIKCHALFGTYWHNNSHRQDDYKYCFFKGNFHLLIKLNKLKNMLSVSIRKDH